MSFPPLRVRAVLAGLLMLAASVWSGFADAYTTADGAISGPAALGTEIIVDPGSSIGTSIPAIAEIDGGFVVVWTEVEGNPADDFDRTTRVFAQRYSDAGAPLGGQIDVATLQGTTNGANVISSNGGFIITGVATKPPVPLSDAPGARDYLAVRYDAAGALDASFDLGQSGETAPLAGGGFVMVWRTDETQSGRLRFQIHDSSGAPVGTESADIDDAIPSQINAQWDVAGLVDGSFVIVYRSAGSDDVYWTRYNPAGGLVSAPARVNNITAELQREPVVTGLSQGGFAIAWTDGGSFNAPAWAIRLQTFTPGGTETGDEVLAASGADADEAAPRLSPLRDGHFALVWNNEQNFIQIHTATGTQRRTPVRLNATDGALPGSSAAISGTMTAVTWFGDGNVRARFYATETEIPELLAPGQGILVNTVTTYDQELSAVAPLAGGGFVVTWADFSQRDVDSQVSEIKAQRFAADGSTVGAEFQVNTTTFGRQHSPDVATLADGGFVIVWQDASNTGGDTESGAVRAQRYDASGVPQGGEFLVNTTTQGEQGQPVVVGLTGGGFAVAWADDIVFGSPQVAGPENIFAQRFDASGTPVGPEINVSGPNTINTQPEIAAFSDGGFAVTWIHDMDKRNFYTSGGRLLYRRYSALGTPGSIVQASAFFDIQEPSITELSDGRFALSYTRYTRSGTVATSGDRVFAQVFEANGTQVTDPFLVAGSLAYEFRASQSEVRPLPGGNLALVWMLAPEGAAPDHIRFQRYEADGTAFGDQLTVNPASPDVETAPHLAPLAGGGFVAVWDDDSGNYGDTDRKAVIASLIGGNAPPVADNDAIALVENAAPVNVAATLLDGDTDPDPGETAGLMIVDSYGLGYVSTNSGATSVSATGVDFLAQGETTTGYLGYVVSDPRGATASALVTATITGINDTPSAADIFGAVPEDSVPADVTDFALATVTDPDTSDTHTITGFNSVGTLGTVTLENGRLLYDPRGQFPDLDDGETYEDSFTYTVSDPFGGSATATVFMDVNGESDLLTVRLTGLGTGQVSSAPAGINCGNGGADCTESLDGTEVTLTAAAAAGSAFSGWTTGPCAGQAGPCTFTAGGNIVATARFTQDSVPPGRIVAATLPGARSGYVGGPVITAYMSVVSRQSTPAQGCTISAPGTPPFTFSYQALDGSNQPTGPASPVFDLESGGTISFVLAMTPATATDAGGHLFQPQIACDNADLAPIDGVNSVLLSIGAAPVPDILSIAATQSNDGVIRIPATGNRVGIMTAAAINIGADDGVSGPGAATITVTPDTGSAALPLTVTVCETNNDGVCLAPRSASVTSVIASEAKLFAVFVRADEGEFVPFDPANARVYLRFRDEGNVLRSVTSAAVSAPAPSSDRPAAASLAGRWSVLVRQPSGDWPSLERGALHVLDDGRAVLASGDTARLLAVSDALTSGDGLVRFELGGSAGLLPAEGAVRLGEPLSDQPGAFWGVRDERSTMAPDWAELAGHYGRIAVAEDGSMRGSLDDCTLTGAVVPALESAPGLRIASVALSGCATSGSYTAILDPAANDNQVPALIIANEDRGWRIAR